MRWTSKIMLISCILCLSALLSCGDNPYSQGENLYLSYCANCHMENGEGVKQLMPPLKASYLLQENPGKVVCMIKYGHEDTVEVNGEIYAGLMPANPDLTEIQITNILNYINNEWGNDYGFTPPDSVFSWLKACEAE